MNNLNLVAKETAKKLLDIGRTTSQVATLLQNCFEMDSLEAHNTIIQVTTKNEQKSIKLRQADRYDLRKGNVLIDCDTKEELKLVEKIDRYTWRATSLTTGKKTVVLSAGVKYCYQVEDKPRKSRKPRKTAFQKWFSTFLEEKEVNLNYNFTVEGESGPNFMSVQNVVDYINNNATPQQQKGIKDMIVKIDFVNGSVIDYFIHLAQPLAI
jgi:hypothetical protein